ncbi:MAG: NAD(P)H-dependent glycerol-3-phosphate dehydrogenase, partial [Paracoccaceae bacterium]
MTIAVIGAGAFGASLAIVQARAGRDVVLWARDPGEMPTSRQIPRLPGVRLPDNIRVTGRIVDVAVADVWLLAVPMQALSGVLPSLPASDAICVACCKGIDLVRNIGPHDVLTEAGRRAAVLTGPSFAADIARDRPTALTLAAGDLETAMRLQAALSTPTLRLYASDDPRGAALGGALKNVVAIACGLAIGAGFGDSARAALMT